MARLRKARDTSLRQFDLNGMQYLLTLAFSKVHELTDRTECDKKSTIAIIPILWILSKVRMLNTKLKECMINSH